MSQDKVLRNVTTNIPANITSPLPINSDDKKVRPIENMIKK